MMELNDIRFLSAPVDGHESAVVIVGFLES